MSEVDLTKLPTGQLSWVKLVDYVATSDDRVERYFLEVKSSVDLNQNADRAKVAKFILGAANRDPKRASARFGGHAVMLLGVGSGEANGIEPFEAMDLARYVTKIIGADGPRWDFERIAATHGRDVIAVHVEPPTGEVWTCRSDAGEGLTDGAIYVRADGETRRATGDEVRLMLQRMRSKAPGVELEVEIVGPAHALLIDEQFLSDIVWGEAQRLHHLASPRPDPYGVRVAMVGMGGETREKSDYLRDVEAWREDALADPLAGTRGLACHVLPGIQLRLVNRTDRYLRGVRVEVTFEEPVEALDWDDPRDAEESPRFPGAPTAWGGHTSFAMLLGTTANTYAVPQPRSSHGVAQVVSSSPANLVMEMDDLRPSETFVSDDDEVVLVMFPAQAEAQVVRGTWRMTAQDVHQVFTGEVEVPVETLDWREFLRNWYLPSSGT